MKRKPDPALPTREQLLEYLNGPGAGSSKRDLGKAFGIKGDLRVPFKALLRSLEAEGALARQSNKKLSTMAGPRMPDYQVIEITGRDADGHIMAKPAKWEERDPPPKIWLDGPGADDNWKTGDRALARLSRADGTDYLARIVRRLEAPRVGALVGVVERSRHGVMLRPCDRREKGTWQLIGDDIPEHGRIVSAEAVAGGRKARVVADLGDANDPRSFSLIAIHAAGIPVEFPAAAVADAEAATLPPLEGRTDYRRVPLVTIDGSDARDFDDAVHAAPDPDPANPGGWKLLVAIADVAYYVRPGAPLDETAKDRGNSVYFPDRVVPMLPEALSNGLCSLRPNEDRGCLVAEMTINAHGQLLQHKFRRGLMRSAARLTYEQAQAARDGMPDDTTTPLLETVIAPLYGAYAALHKARRERGTLDLDLPELFVRLGENGHVADIRPRQRLNSHRLIEEFMILANVAAATTLEEAGAPALYRVHESPDPLRIEGLALTLKNFGHTLKAGKKIEPSHLSDVLERVAGKVEAPLISELVLRSQAQARYAPENMGHFGLALERYAHFTSPIRRYADLIVHRSLIRMLGLGKGGLAPAEIEGLADTADHISGTERRAAAAERDAQARYITAWLADRVGEHFPGRISGVTRFGLFVTLIGIGADGLIPIASLGGDFFHHDETRQALIGRRTGTTYVLTQPVTVELTGAETETGSLQFRLVSAGDVPGGPLPLPPDADGPRRRFDQPGKRFKGPSKGAFKGRGKRR